MPKKYTSEQFWQLYKKLPQELKNAVFAEETDDNIYNTCKKNGVLENHQKIIENVGNVLIGVLPPNEFQEIIEKELELKKNIAKKIAQEINRFIFYPVKAGLEELYNMEIIPPAQMKVPSPVEKEPKPSKRKDTYREIVE